ncbi:hypothetical protein ACJRO7_001880 [Eucalyptus globulus]|uniref:Uncharacterized protein n=1 Tax=Eucalyptus globulus TaxID=34317 RepID=A0ABD3LW97_EUCGL
MEAVPLRAHHDNKENVPSLSAGRINPQPADTEPCLKKRVVNKAMARKPLADVTNLFVFSSVLTCSSSARASSDLSMLHFPSLYPKKRRALDDVDLWRATARSAKSLRMGFR